VLYLGAGAFAGEVVAIFVGEAAFPSEITLPFLIAAPFAKAVAFCAGILFVATFHLFSKLVNFAADLQPLRYKGQRLHCSN